MKSLKLKLQKSGSITVCWFKPVHRKYDWYRTAGNFRGCKFSRSGYAEKPHPPQALNVKYSVRGSFNVRVYCSALEKHKLYGRSSFLLIPPLLSQHCLAGRLSNPSFLLHHAAGTNIFVVKQLSKQMGSFWPDGESWKLPICLDCLTTMLCLLGMMKQYWERQATLHVSKSWLTISNLSHHTTRLGGGWTCSLIELAKYTWACQPKFGATLKI